MPGWWAELLTLLHTFGFWFMVMAVAFGIIFQYLVRPYFTKVSGGFHQVVRYTSKQHEASLHPTRKKGNGNADLITRQEMLTEMGEIKGGLLGLDTHLQELDEIISGKFCTDACPVYAVLKEMTGRVLESDSELHRRLDTFLDTALATVMAAVEKRISDRKNGSG